MRITEYIPSSEQGKLLQSNYTLANVTYSCYHTAVKTMGLMAMDSIRNGKKIVLVIPEEKVRIALVDFLESTNMRDVLLSCKVHSKLDHYDFENLKKNIFRNSTDTKIVNKAKFEYDRIRSLTHLVFEKKYITSHDGKNWRNAVDEYVMLQADHRAKLMARYINSAFCPKNERELDQLLDIVQEGIHYYSPTFQSLQNSVLKNYVNFSKLQLNALNEVTHDIFTLREEATTLRDKFLNASKDIEENFLEAKLEAILHLEYQCDSTAFDYVQYTNQTKKEATGFLSGILKGKQNETENDAKSLLENCRAIASQYFTLCQKQISHPENETQILWFCDHVKGELSTFRSSLSHLAPELLKSVNRFNHAHPMLSALEQELTIFIHQTNSLDILIQKLEINTLSFSKQVDFIVDLVSRFDLILSEIEQNIQYFQWCDFLEQLQDHQKDILRVLTRFEINVWADTIHAWYLYHQITNDFLHLSHWTTDEKTQYINTHVQCLNESLQNQVLSLQEKNVPFFKSLKSTDPDAYKYFSSKNPKEHWTWRFLLNQKMALTSSIYPVIITDQDDLSDMSKSENTHLVVYNKKDVNTEIMQLFDQITYFWNENEYQTIPDFRLIFKGDENRPHCLLATSERLGVVRTIAHLVLSAKALPHVFLMKDTCILSYASAMVNTHVLNELYPLGIKKIFVEDDPYKILIGALLEAEKNIYVITEDHLLHPDDTNHILEQVHILDQMEQYGCQLLNVSVTDLLASYNHLDHITDTISLAQEGLNKSDKKQLTFEFI